MSHRDALQRLIPVALAGSQDVFLTVAGHELDVVQESIENLRKDIVSDVLGVLPPTSSQIKLVPVAGDVKKPHFVALAAALGYTVGIIDYTPAMPGWSVPGDDLWTEPFQDFSAGLSGAGESLGGESELAILPACWRVVVTAESETVTRAEFESLFWDLGPAHIHLVFIYP